MRHDNILYDNIRIRTLKNKGIKITLRFIVVRDKKRQVSVNSLFSIRIGLNLREISVEKFKKKKKTIHGKL